MPEYMFPFSTFVRILAIPHSFANLPRRARASGRYRGYQHGAHNGGRNAS